MTRCLTPEEILRLRRNGCMSTDWSRVKFAEPFIPENFRYVIFSGDVTVGRTDRHLAVEGVPFSAGISNALIHNCEIADYVHISCVADFIANYRIGEQTIIRNICRLGCHEGATFGIGTQVAVLNETGGREVPLFEQLSAQIAYMLAMYRHDTPLIDGLMRLIDARRDRVRSDMGTIGCNVTITNSASITDVNIGPYATIEAATRLNNGTIVSTKESPVRVGTSVMADDFVLEAGSRVDDAAVITHTFVGEGSHITNQFSAHDSLFFANCTCQNGEACAIFAGPYTVTMHKSSLLIAGMFSFLNAGSGSNQSNHMYKLGPIHQGVVERGSKTTSDSYILWPARIGAFSLVMGRHASNPDTSLLPFSYLIENHGITYVVPGANLKNVGTKRDELKWPQRDRRKSADGRVLDQINFDILNPYTVEKMMAGARLLRQIESDNIAVDGVYTYRGLHIRTSSLRKGRDYYATAIDKFMGACVIARLEGLTSFDNASIRTRLAADSDAGCDSWIDIAGLYAPITEIARLRDNIVGGRMSLEQINDAFRAIAADYPHLCWNWVANHLSEWHGKPADEFTAEDLIAVTERWLTAELFFDRLLIDDAAKEFSEISRRGFGIDNPNWAEADFRAVRGSLDTNPFVTMVTDDIKRKQALADTLKARFTYSPKSDE